MAAAAAEVMNQTLAAANMQQATVPTGNSSSGKATKFKKAPGAPKRFKSAFIIFSSEKHKIIKEEQKDNPNAKKTTDIAKLVSEEWRNMPPEEKKVWEEKASKDKARYEMEKAMYRGPWKVAARKRSPKDPTAPKRPMSAFLAYSNKRRAALKRENQSLTNSDLSKMLSASWKKEKEEVKQKYMDEEKKLRDQYKIDVAEWRKKAAEEKLKERQEREAFAMQAAEARAKDPNAVIPGLNPPQNSNSNQMQGFPNMMNAHMMGMAGFPHQSMMSGRMQNPMILQQLMAQQHLRSRNFGPGGQMYPMGGVPMQGAPADAHGNAETVPDEDNMEEKSAEI